LKIPYIAAFKGDTARIEESLFNFFKKKCILKKINYILKMTKAKI